MRQYARLSKIENEFRAELGKYYKGLGEKILKLYNSNIDFNPNSNHTFNLIVLPLKDSEEEFQKLLLKYQLLVYNQGQEDIQELINIENPKLIATKKQVTLDFFNKTKETIQTTMNDYNIFNRIKKPLQKIGINNIRQYVPFKRNLDNVNLDSTRKIVRKPNARAIQILKTHNMKLSQRTRARITEKVRDILTINETKGSNARMIGDLIKQEFNTLAKYESERLARTEIMKSHNMAKNDEIQNNDLIDYVQWLATEDERTRESHAELNGIIIRKGDIFPNGCEYPGDPNGEAEEVINCRCTLLPYIPEYGYIAPPDMDYFTESDFISITNFNT